MYHDLTQGRSQMGYNLMVVPSASYDNQQSQVDPVRGLLIVDVQASAAHDEPTERSTMPTMSTMGTSAWLNYNCSPLPYG